MMDFLAWDEIGASRLFMEAAASKGYTGDFHGWGWVHPYYLIRGTKIWGSSWVWYWYWEIRLGFRFMLRLNLTTTRRS